MATYTSGSWTAINLPTNQRRTDYNPWQRSEFREALPDRVPDDFLNSWRHYNNKNAFITNASGYDSWTGSSVNPQTGRPWPQWTLKTNPNEQMFVNMFPANRTTSKQYYVAYDKTTKKWTGYVRGEKQDPQPENIRYKTITVDPSSKNLGEWLDAQDHNGTPITGSVSSGARDGLKEKREIMQTNENDNAQDMINRQTAMAEWNFENVYQPAGNYIDAHNAQGQTYREDASNIFNSEQETRRQQAADQENSRGDLRYDYANGMNNWSQEAVNWARNTGTGNYVDNRSHILNELKGSLSAFQANINNRAGSLGLREALLTNTQVNEMIEGMKNSYGAYYVKERVPMWNGATDGGTYDLIGNFDYEYYLNKYGDSRGLYNSWANATQYGDASNPFDPNNDLDITARYGTLADMAWYDYSTSGQAEGLRGSEASATEQADSYSESYETLTDAEKQEIRDRIFGLTGEGGTIEWAENILDPTNDDTPSFLEGTVAGVFSEKDLEQQDIFQGLAQNVLRTSVDQLRRQQEKERGMDIFRGLPGFSEIYGASSQLANSLLGDSGIGGYLGMLGVNTQSLTQSLTEELEGVTGISNNHAEFNWNKWMNETVKPYFEGLEEIEGERVDEEGNKILYDLTTKEGKEFIEKFLNEYITPRFNLSKSMSEFVSYLDTLDENEQNIFQTQTAMNSLKQRAELEAKNRFQLLQNAEANVFNTDYYFDPISSLGLNNLSEEELENNYMNVQQTLERYQKQHDVVNRDWAAAKADGSSKLGIPEHAQAYNWEQWAYFYGVDLNNRDDFARLHYQVAGQGQFDPAEDVISYNTINDYFSDVLIPLLEEEKISYNDAAFMQFVTPDEFANAILEGINPLDNKEEWKQVLEQFGIDDLDASLEEVKEYIKEVFETGEAQAIREGIKYLNQKKQQINQETLGVDYIQRDPEEILGQKGDIPEGSDAWKELMLSYDLPEDYTYEQASNALLNIEVVESDSTNPIYQIFVSQGYAGTEEEFYAQMFPDATSEEIADLNFVGSALQGDLSLSNLSSDPFQAMYQFESFLGGTEGDLYGIGDDDDREQEYNYFDLFPGEQEEQGSGYGSIDSWTGGLFGFG